MIEGRILTYTYVYKILVSHVEKRQKFPQKVYYYFSRREIDYKRNCRQTYRVKGGK